MKPTLPLALFAFALPLGALTASAQNQRSSITSFDRDGNPVIQYTSPSDEDVAADGVRSSITSFDRDGNPVIRYTSPPLNTTAPNPNPGYQRFGYRYGTPGNGYYPYPSAPAPAFGYTPPAYTIPLGSSIYGPNANSLTVVPLSPEFGYPAPGYPYYPPPAYPYGAPPYGYPAGGYGYPAPPYGYPAGGYGYPAGGYGYPTGGYGYGYGTGSVYSQSTGYGVNFGRGGLSVSIGGGNYSSSSRTTTTVRSR